ncbi:MAG: diguanylate cyclase [Natronospirillum sp.]|uniref:diguanylate cyclase n=1 Tax=Natronospirillum sp. TaxID=2812955 RepID=UPI0025EBC644|nr:diguanylate cyclase [Natronospirillum sp.]MCH8550371.1 diguanylate cyclase [Natronospirillum sp.]
MASKKDSVQSQLDWLRDRFLERLNDDTAALAEMLAQLEEADADSPRQAQLLEQIRDRLHRLAGSSGTFGFSILGDQARLLEHRLDACLSSTVGADDVLRALLPGLREFIAHPPTDTLAGGSSSTNAPAEPVEHAPGQVLLFEPEQAIAERIAGQLRPFGFAVDIVSRTKTLSDRLTLGPVPELICLDLDALGEAEEQEVLTQTMSGLSHPVSLVVFSEREDLEQRLRAARLGAAGFMTKPLDVLVAVNLLVRVIERQHYDPPRILIIEDDDLLAQHFTEILSQAGMTVRYVADPEAFFQQVAEFQPDLVVLDLHLPEIQGDELAAVLRQQETWATLPIMYISAETDQHRQAAALKRGADDFLTKPVSDETLITSIQTRVERAREMRILISRDGMTGLLKHSSFLQAASTELDRSRRNQTSAVFVMLDLDHFKKVNDTWGHATGDLVIRALATMLRQRLRQTDIIGRYGGEEFAAVLTDCSTQDAETLLNEVRERFSEINFRANEGSSFHCTLSAGLVNASDHAETTSGELIELADQALYAAKKAGRNQVQVG